MSNPLLDDAVGVPTGESSAGVTGGVLCALGTSFAVALYMTLARLLMDQGLRPYALGCCYCAGCSAFTLLSMVARGRGREIIESLRLNGKRLLLICCLGSTIQSCLLTGLELAGPVSQSILMRTDVLFTIVVGWLAFRIRVGPWHLAAMAIMLAGTLRTICVSPTRILGGADPQALIGNCLFLVAAIGISINGFLIKGVMQRVRRDLVVGVNVGMMSVTFGVASLVTSTHGEFARLLTGASTLRILAIIIVGQVLTYTTYYKSLSSLPVWLVRIFTLVTPVATAVTSYLILRKPPTSFELQGMALVMIGAALAIWRLRVQPIA